MSEKDISRFISHLSINRHVAASTQNQALNAIVFLYKQVLNMELGDFGKMERFKKPKKLPVVLTKAEVQKILASISGTNGLMAKLLYGCGLRLMECLRLRIEDIDFNMSQIIIRSGKGDKEWHWQYMFPSEKLWRSPRTGRTGRHHLDESALQRAVKIAARLE